jgi:hypothetical protein
MAFGSAPAPLLLDMPSASALLEAIKGSLSKKGGMVKNALDLARRTLRDRGTGTASRSRSDSLDVVQIGQTGPGRTLWPYWTNRTGWALGASRPMCSVDTRSALESLRSALPTESSLGLGRDVHCLDRAVLDVLGRYDDGRRRRRSAHTTTRPARRLSKLSPFAGDRRSVPPSDAPLVAT